MNPNRSPSMVRKFKPDRLSTAALFLSLLLPVLAGCSSAQPFFITGKETTAPGKDPLVEANRLVEKTANDVFGSRPEYTGIVACYHPGIGVIVQANNGKLLNPMFRNAEYLKDLEANSEFAEKAARLPEIDNNGRIIISIKSEIGEQVRNWSVSYLRRLEEEKRAKTNVPVTETNPKEAELATATATSNGMESEKPDLHDFLYTFNGINRDLGGYPDWIKLNDEKLELIKKLEAHGYQAQGFILPAFGIILSVRVEKLDSDFLKEFQRDAYRALHPHASMNPGLLLHIYDDSRRLLLVQDMTGENDLAVHTLFFKKDVL